MKYTLNVDLASKQTLRDVLASQSSELIKLTGRKCNSDVPNDVSKPTLRKLILMNQVMISGIEIGKRSVTDKED